MIFAQTHSFAESRGDGLWSRHDEPQMELGEAFNAQRDNVFTSYIRYGEDVAIGDLLKSKNDLLALTSAGVLDGDLAVGTKQIPLAATSTLSSILSDGLFTNDTDLKEMRGYALLRAVDTAGPTYRRAIVIGIQAQRLDVIWLTSKGTLDVALADATTSIELQAPWILEKAGATDHVVAVAQAAGKKKEFGLVLYCGFGAIKAGAAIAAGAPLRPIASGEADDEAGGTQPEAVIASALTAGLDDEVIWANIDCKPISKIPFQADPFLRGTKRPGE